MNYNYIPSYRKLSRSEFGAKVRLAEELLLNCTLCPRNCHVNRKSGNVGFCKTGDKPIIASWGPHFGEERVLVGRFGSGTIFFSRCNLKCIFCQNWYISFLGQGNQLSIEALAKIMIELQRRNCHNINLVTPTHQMPMILHSILLASEMGLQLPIVYNCGGYESVEALKILDGVIDIYMPDFKYSNSFMADNFSNAKNYPEIAKLAIKEMHRQVGDLLIDENGIALKGLLIRHLVLPNNIAGTAEIMRYIAEEISNNTYINIMDQYYPSYNAFAHPAVNRKITSKEYSDAIKIALSFGLKRIDTILV